MTTYVVSAYGVFAGILVTYVGILVPRARSRRRAIAQVEARLREHGE